MFVLLLALLCTSPADARPADARPADARPALRGPSGGAATLLFSVANGVNGGLVGALGMQARPLVCAVLCCRWSGPEGPRVTKAEKRDTDTRLLYRGASAQG